MASALRRDFELHTIALIRTCMLAHMPMGLLFKPNKENNDSPSTRKVQVGPKQ